MSSIFAAVVSPLCGEGGGRDLAVVDSSFPTSRMTFCQSCQDLGRLASREVQFVNEKKKKDTKSPWSEKKGSQKFVGQPPFPPRRVADVRITNYLSFSFSSWSDVPAPLPRLTNFSWHGAGLPSLEELMQSTQ